MKNTFPYLDNQPTAKGQGPKAHNYDYIVTGGGAAGRSFLHALLHSALSDHRVLLIDEAPKTRNDRTWCFWERTPGPFEDIVFHRWSRLWFYQGDFQRQLDIRPYEYKMIRGLDFYRYTDELLARHPNVERRYGRVEALTNMPDGVRVTVDGQVFQADYVFNSIFFGQVDKQKVNYLDQHFRGWFIRTEAPAFSPDDAILMDFRTPQFGETRFLYVLPNSEREALVEIAIFSNRHLEPQEYDTILADYLRAHWPRIGPYTIEAVETGNIPMTDHPFPPADGRIVHLGMAGGDTRASTGYTFWNIQRRVREVVEALVTTGQPYAADSWPVWRARRYDSLLLRVLEQGYFPGDELFRRLFAKIPPHYLLAFLNAESSLLTELRVVHQMPTSPFLYALWKEVWPRLMARK